MDRREFLETSGVLAGGAVLGGIPVPSQALKPPPMIGIQVGAVSFVDEGTDRVLDSLRELASVNTLFVATLHLRARHRRASASEPAAARSRQAGIRHRDLPRRQLRDAASSVLPEHEHHARTRARSSQLRRARRRASARASARHEGDRLVRGCVCRGRAGLRSGARSGARGTACDVRPARAIPTPATSGLDSSRTT